MVNQRAATASQVKRYPVAEDINEPLLDRLSFKRYYSQLPGWVLYTRRNEEGINEFAAIYGIEEQREFLVEGPFSIIEVTQRDLENMDRYMLNEGWISRKIRNKSPLIVIPVFAPILEGTGISIYNLINKTIEEMSRNERIYDVATPIFLGFAGMIGVAGLMALAPDKLLNRYYGSKLSDEAESYLCGGEAERKLRGEFNLKRIQSGELKISDLTDEYLSEMGKLKLKSDIQSRSSTILSKSE